MGKSGIGGGPIAVSYFYVLSGFIMAIAYYRPEQPQQAFATRRYWWARIARIYPVYLLALLLMIAAKYQTVGSEPLTVALSVSMLQAWIPGYPITLNTPGWSLSVEAFFYLCFPLLILLVKRYPLSNLTLAAGILWLVTQLGHGILLNTEAYAPRGLLHDFIFYNPLMHLNTFMIGFIAGAWLRTGRLNRFSAPLINISGLLLVSVLIIGLLISRKTLIDASGIAFDYTNGLIAPLFLLFIVLLALNTGKISQCLQHKWLVLLGEASFSLYILQKPLHGIYEKLMPIAINPHGALHFYVFVVLLTISALCSYWFFEAPARRWLNNFVNRTP
ncbi:acyltransferase family protein [Thiothrix subterranea]|uniref:acyltransferase family protein n=1 Tax=Thiothrix subterranea TaxID=2735563 RepID=UPI00280BBD86|nr:acyltransferase [Thiothrix subterranea]